MPTPDPASPSSAAGDYRKVIRALALRAARLGSRDPEGAAQEAIRRSLAHASSRPAIEYYFREQLSPGAEPPEWSLAQLLGWLHGVLRFVISEDRSRASSHREIATPMDELVELPDRAPSPQDAAIDAELRGIVHECVMQLGDERRAALLLRLQGAKYEEIARRLAMNENTVATWLHRSSRELIERVRDRMDGRPAASRTPSPAVAKVSHA